MISAERGNPPLSRKPKKCEGGLSKEIHWEETSPIKEPAIIQNVLKHQADSFQYRDDEGLDSNNAEIGKIEILKSFSFFEIENTMDNKLIESLKGKKFDDVPLLVEVSSGKSEGGYSKEKSDRSYSKRNFSKKKSFGGKSKFGNKRNNDKKGGGRGKRKQW